MEPRYKIGDIVRIVENNGLVGKHPVFTEIMRKFKGAVFIIKYPPIIGYGFDHPIYVFRYDGVMWYYLDECWLELVKQASILEDSQEPIVATQPETDQSEHLTGVFLSLWAEFKKLAASGQYSVFPVWNLQGDRSEIMSALSQGRIDGLAQQSQATIQETLRLLGVAVYHLSAGESEFTDLCFQTDGYITPLDSAIWPIIAELANGRINTIERLDRLVADHLNRRDEPISDLLKTTNILLALEDLSRQGLKIIRHDLVAEVWDLPLPKDVKIRYSEETLSEAIRANQDGEQWILAYYSGQSLADMRRPIGKGKEQKVVLLDPNDTWCLAQEESFWTTKKMEQGYYLVNFKARFANRSWMAQEDLIAELGPAYGRCYESIVVEAILSNYCLNNKEKLLNSYHWGREFTSAGHRVAVGGFSDTFKIRAEKPIESTKNQLNVIVYRKFDF